MPSPIPRERLELALERLEKFIQFEPNSGCWIWIGSRNQKGYGRTSIAGRDEQAHRVLYEAAHGPIEDGLVSDHLCRLRSCTNPGHTEPVTNRTNLVRGEGIIAHHVQAEKCPQGHDYAGTNLIVKVYRDGRRERKCRTCKRSQDRTRARRLTARLEAPRG